MYFRLINYEVIWLLISHLKKKASFINLQQIVSKSSTIYFFKYKNSYNLSFLFTAKNPFILSLIKQPKDKLIDLFDHVSRLIPSGKKISDSKLRKEDCFLILQNITTTQKDKEEDPSTLPTPSNSRI